MDGNNDFFENFERNKYLKKITQHAKSWGQKFRTFFLLDKFFIGFFHARMKLVYYQSFVYF